MNRKQFDKKLFETQKEKLLSWLYLESTLPYSLESNVDAVFDRLEQLEKELKQTKLNFRNSQTHSKNCYKKLKEKYERVKEVYHRNYELIQENGKLKQTINILKEKGLIFTTGESGSEVSVCLCDYGYGVGLTQGEYELLKEVFESVGDSDE